MRNSERFDDAIARIDAANRGDPAHEIVDGVPVPGALLYGRRMSERLAALAPAASEALRLAVRAQHLMRWAIPRDRYPDGRKGYHEWRASLARFHAGQAGEILRLAGYGEDEAGRVQALLRKERLKWDAEAQTLEDTACLVFLEHYLPAFAAKHMPGKIAGILRKTWRKMSPAGQQAALRLPLAAESRALVDRALAG